MTVCIAVACENWQTLVCVADRMISTGSEAAETMQKGWRPHHAWLAFSAGNDVASGDPILKRLSEALTLREGVTREEMRYEFCREYRAEVADQVDALVLAPHGLTTARFLKEAVNPKRYRDLRKEIRTVGLGCEFLVCGFEPGHSSEAEIFHVVSPGRFRSYSRYGYWAIGSGAARAVNTLVRYQYHPERRNWVDAAYYACLAKFDAEPEVGIGPQTSLIRLEPDGKLVVVEGQGEVFEEIRKAWRISRRLVVPENVKTMLERRLGPTA